MKCISFKASPCPGVILQSVVGRLQESYMVSRPLVRIHFLPRLKNGIRIADVATGTGAWMPGLNREAPVQLRLDGMDINLAQAPLKQWLPPNINMRTWNIFEEVPDDLVGQFDVYTSVFVLLVVQNETAASVVKNLGKLLNQAATSSGRSSTTLTTVSLPSVLPSRLTHPRNCTSSSTGAGSSTGRSSSIS